MEYMESKMQDLYDGWDAQLAETCPQDGAPCYVGAGTEDAHWRCGTSACGCGAVVPWIGPLP